MADMMVRQFSVRLEQDLVFDTTWVPHCRPVDIPCSVFDKLACHFGLPAQHLEVLCQGKWSTAENADSVLGILLTDSLKHTAPLRPVHHKELMYYCPGG